MSPLRGLVGVSHYGKTDFYNTPRWKHTMESEFDVTNVTALPRVDILYAYADMNPDLIDALWCPMPCESLSLLWRMAFEGSSLPESVMKQ